MQKNILTFISLFFIIAFASCNNGIGGLQDPKAVTKAFIDALGKGDMDEAAKHVTKESQGMISMMKMGIEMAKNQGGGDKMNDAFAEFQGKKITYADPKIDGETATVTVTMDERQGLPILLKKEDGEWKVAFDIKSLMETHSKGMGQTKISSGDIDSNLNQLGYDADSVRKLLNKNKPMLDSLKKLLPQN